MTSGPRVMAFRDTAYIFILDTNLFDTMRREALVP